MSLGLRSATPHQLVTLCQLGVEQRDHLTRLNLWKGQNEEHFQDGLQKDLGHRKFRASNKLKLLTSRQVAELARKAVKKLDETSSSGASGSSSDKESEASSGSMPTYMNGRGTKKDGAKGKSKAKNKNAAASAKNRSAFETPSCGGAVKEARCDLLSRSLKI